jgi:hypothetical protein
MQKFSEKLMNQKPQIALKRQKKKLKEREN